MKHGALAVDADVGDAAAGGDDVLAQLESRRRAGRPRHAATLTPRLPVSSMTRLRGLLPPAPFTDPRRPEFLGGFEPVVVEVGS